MWNSNDSAIRYWSLCARFRNKQQHKYTIARQLYRTGTTLWKTCTCKQNILYRKSMYSNYIFQRYSQKLQNIKNQVSNEIYVERVEISLSSFSYALVVLRTFQ